jgi:hypothetical protein
VQQLLGPQSFVLLSARRRTHLRAISGPTSLG